MFLCGCFRIKNSDLKVFEEAGLHADLIMHAKKPNVMMVQDHKQLQLLMAVTKA